MVFKGAFQLKSFCDFMKLILSLIALKYLLRWLCELQVKILFIFLDQE